MGQTTAPEACRLRPLQACSDRGRNHPEFADVAGGSYYSDDVIIRNVKVLAPYPSRIRTPSILFIVEREDRSCLCRRGDDDMPSSRPRSALQGPMRRAAIYHHRLQFLHGHGLSIGSEIAGGAQNILAERIHFEGTDNGIR